MHKRSSKIFQPGQLPNSEKNADKMHVCPDIANANVGRIFIFVSRLKFLKSFLSPKQ
jgi:hypothetical protein